MFKRNKGSAMPMLLVACMVIAMISAILFENQNMYTVKENIDRELARAANIAVDLAMDDSARRYHISRIDKDKAQDEFYNYLYDFMELSPSLEHKTGMKYRLVLTKVDIEPEEPLGPYLSVQGYVEIAPMYMESMLPGFKMQIPIKAKSRNKRMD